MWESYICDRCADKTMLEVTGDDVKNVCNTDQLCSGIKSGMEGAIHAIRQLYQEKCDDGFGLLLMDASNAFQTISRAAALWNARVLWSRCARFLFNSYRGYALLIIKGTSATLLSKEGVTQGVPSSMKLYAIGLLPLVQKLRDSSDYVKQELRERASKNMLESDTSKDICESPRWIQIWYADDLSNISYLRFLFIWLKLLLK